MISRKPAIGFVFVTLALDVLGLGLIVPILPKLVQELGGGSVEEASMMYGALTAIYSLMQFVFAPALGSLSDRFGRRPVILASLLGSGLDYFLLAFAPNLTWFFLGRVIAGITGANFAAATAYIADVSPPEKRAANFGLIGAAFGLGFILGPALGGLLGDVGLRVPFLVAGVLTLLNCLYGWLALPESLSPANRRAFSWGRSNPIGALIYLRSKPMVLGLAGVFFIYYLAHQALPGTWVLYTSYRYDWTVRETGLSLAVAGLSTALVQGFLTRRVVSALGEERSALLGLMVFAATYAAYALAPQGWMLYVILVLGSPAGFTSPSIQAIISREVGPDEQGGVQGALTSLSSVSGIIGVPLATGLFSFFISERAPFHLPGASFLFGSAMTLTSAGFALWLFRRRARHERNGGGEAGRK